MSRRASVPLCPARPALAGGVALALALVLALARATALPAPAGRGVAVSAVYPSGAALPVNVLRISLAFGAAPVPPLLPRLALRYADGAAVGQAFLHQELWSPDGRTLTLLFDPGRVKTGTLAHRRYGYALAPGKTVALLLDGRILKAWRVVRELRSGPDFARWRVTAPPAGTRAPLELGLGSAIDVLSRDAIVPVGPGGRRVAGRPALAAGETVWSFVPAQAWRPGRYRLVIDPRLEDAAGNAIAGSFERRAARSAAESESTPLSVPYAITNARRVRPVSVPAASLATETDFRGRRCARILGPMQHNRTSLRSLFVAFASACAFVSAGAPAGAAPGVELASVSRIAFGPGGVLFAADWKRARIVAFELPATTAHEPRPFNLHALSALLASTLGRSDIAIEDIAPRPHADQVYVAVSLGAERAPAIVAVNADGSATRLDLAALPSTSAALDKPPTGDWTFLATVPARSFTVTDMKWHAGRLYVAGLSNLAFSSALRVLPYPFTGRQRLATIEIYHTSHNQIETRAPIRALAFADLSGTPSLIATYTCTPLVTIPLAALRDGAHVRGKTIAELGFGNTPDDMVVYSASTLGGPVQPYVLVSNAMRNAELIPLASIARAAARPGYTAPVPFGKQAGVDMYELPFAGVARIADEGGNYLVALRRDLRTGAAELVSYDKRMDFRLSDFPASEYTFPGYSYAAHGAFQAKYIKPGQDMLKLEEGYPAPLRR